MVKGIFNMLLEVWFSRKDC